MPGSVATLADLLQRLLVTGLLEEPRVRVHAPGHAHAALARDLVDELADVRSYASPRVRAAGRG